MLHFASFHLKVNGGYLKAMCNRWVALLQPLQMIPIMTSNDLNFDLRLYCVTSVIHLAK